MTDYQRELVWLLHGSGHPLNDIAERTGLTEEEVREAIFARWRDLPL